MLGKQAMAETCRLGPQESLFILERRYAKEVNGVDSEVVTCFQSSRNFVILDQAEL